MIGEIPFFQEHINICIVCEGSEEYDYLNRLNDLGVWNDAYNIYLDNAGGNGNIPARYQDRFQNGSFDMIFIFCDTEKKPFEQYEDIKRKINEFHGVDDASDEIIIFSNPCTLQVVLLHLDNVTLTSPAKRTNAALIHSLTGIENYRAKEGQRKDLMLYITAENFSEMCERVRIMGEDDKEPGNSNFNKLVKYLTSKEHTWIEAIEARLEEG